VVSSGSTYSIYFDGELQNVAEISGETVCNDGPFYIGGSPWYSSFSGKINYFAVYDRSLSVDEVNTHADDTVWDLNFTPEEE